MSNYRDSLETLSNKMLSDPEVSSNLPPEVRESGWLGFPGCTNEQIVEAERRLNVKFPPSLRQFYETSNGWRHFNSFVYSILPIEKIDYLPVLEPGLASVVGETKPIPGDPEYFDEQVTRVLRSIVLSLEGDSTTTLIDPKSDVGDGEWDVGAWASWHPAMEWSNMNWRSYVESQGPT